MRRFIAFGLFLAPCAILNAQQIPDACWTGTWTGTYSFQTASCGLTDSGTVTLTISSTDGVITGSGTEDGVLCYNTSTCEITGSGTLSGSLSGTVTGNQITLSGSWVNSCNGLSYGTGFGGTLSGCTISGYPNLTLTKQEGCLDCNTVQFGDIPDSLPPTVRMRQSYSLSPLIAPQTLTAIVADSDGVGVPGISVSISIVGNNVPAGHDGPHDPSVVHGWIIESDAPLTDDNGVAISQSVQVAKNALGGSQKDTQLDLTTDENGEISFVYVPAEVSGIDTITAKIQGSSGTPQSADITIKVDGLVPLMGVTSFPFALFGVTPTHSINWFAAPNTINGLQSTASMYHDTQFSDSDLNAAISELKSFGYDFPDSEPSGTFRGGSTILPSDPEILFINDISLPWGGLFDAPDIPNPGNFSAPHGGHRDGSNVDLKSNHLIKPGAPPYNAVGGKIKKLASANLASGDSRLTGAGQAPFRNLDFYTNSTGTAVHYNSKIRNQMNKLVQAVHYRRFQLLIGALQTSGCSFANETDHIHVKFP